MDMEQTNLYWWVVENQESIKSLIVAVAGIVVVLVAAVLSAINQIKGMAQAIESGNVAKGPKEYMKDNKGWDILGRLMVTVAKTWATNKRAHVKVEGYLDEIFKELKGKSSDER